MAVPRKKGKKKYVLDPKLKALQLAVSVLAKLSDEINQGTEIVLRQKNGDEVKLWEPHLRKRLRK